MKKFKIEFNVAVIDEVKEIILWYNNEQKGLGYRFSAELKSAIKFISQYPFQEVRYKNIRCFYLKPFPYLIHFYIDEDSHTVIILGVISTHQNPKTKWK